MAYRFRPTLCPTIAALGLAAFGAACGSSASDASADGGARDGGSSEAAGSGGGSGGGYAGDGSLIGSSGGGDGSSDAPTATPGVITGTVRDFKFYDGTSATNPDFEDPPYGIGQNGQPSAGYAGDWNDTEIVAAMLGSDGKPVYKNPNGTPDANGRVTLTTHGKMWFDQWFHDAPGYNLDVSFPLPLSMVAAGDGGTQYGYDSQVSGVSYTPSDPTSGKGFFPIDDGTPYGSPAQKTFGNQALTNPPNPTPTPDPSAADHNFSFTFELHTVFTYRGGETFEFRGDDDVFVYVDKNLVINLGGVHSPETATVAIDSLGLTAGQQYPLDFFSVERHVSGSNILFTTTLVLRPAPQ